jgi:hypothetical protein
LLPGSRRLGGATGSEADEDRFLSRFAGSGQQVARTTQYVHEFEMLYLYATRLGK